MAVQLSILRARAQERADAQSDPHFDNSELDRYCNEGYSELWELLAAANERYFETSATFTLAAGVSTKTLVSIDASDIFRVMGLRKKYGTRYGNPLPIVSYGERAEPDELSFDVVGDSIAIFPSEDAAGDYQVDYIPAFVPLPNDASTLHARIMSGWEEFIICHAASIMLGKQRRDTSEVLRRKEELAKRIRSSAERRIQGGPRKIAKVRGTRGFRYLTRSGWPIE